ncbi:MAG TPA: hypothetical protein VI172_09190 [Candidatus Dormibacteraeota bacterium]
MTTTTSAAERIAAVRDEYASFGEDVTGLSDTELLLRQVDRAWAESRRHENNYSNLLQDQIKHDRSVYAAARRSAQGDVTARAGLYLNVILRNSARPINEVVHRASELPTDGKAPLQQVRDLKAAADNAKWLLSGMVGDRQGLESAAKDPGVQLVEKLNGEIRRLREVVMAEGRRLHAGHGHRQTGPRCECTGCELIRAIDDVPTEQATPTTSAATAAGARQETVMDATQLALFPDAAVTGSGLPKPWPVAEAENADQVTFDEASPVATEDAA